MDAKPSTESKPEKAGLTAKALRERAKDWHSLFYFYGPHGAKAVIAIYTDLADMLDGKPRVQKPEKVEKKPRV